jgi:hypothetical protein
MTTDYTFAVVDGLLHEADMPADLEDLLQDATEPQQVGKYRFSIEVDAEPPRPAPQCNNPDSPLFSDPGDGGSVEVRVVRHNLTPAMLAAVEAWAAANEVELAGDALEEDADRLEAQREDAADARREERWGR